MDIWFKVMKIHWSQCVRTLVYARATTCTVVFILYCISLNDEASKLDLFGIKRLEMHRSLQVKPRSSRLHTPGSTPPIQRVIHVKPCWNHDVRPGASQGLLCCHGD